jgi:hypothetical protein
MRRLEAEDSDGHDNDRYLSYFPEENPEQLGQDEIIEILDQAKAPDWNQTRC